MVVTIKPATTMRRLYKSSPDGPNARRLMPTLLTATLSLLTATPWLASCAGCYDGQELVTQVRSAALNTRLAEVDLGAFHTTLPRDAKTGSITELSLHIFGTVPRYRVPAVEKQLKTDEYRLRHETLAAVRGCSREELAEPSLNSLRTRIERIVNNIFDEAPIKDIGFYKVTIRQL